MIPDDILKKLEQCSYWEDEFVSSYDSESVWDLLMTLGEPKFSRIRKLLLENIEDSRNHKALIESILESAKHDK